VVKHDLHWSWALLGHQPEGDWEFLPETFKIVDTCRVTTVPKDAKTDRTIAIEPTGNLFLQKGIGGYFRDCLKRVGVDLNDQGVNQNLARIAQAFGLATLDLSAASDSVSIELVYELLPIGWASLLDDLRSPKALLPNGDITVLEKFSSMGNGFTFELESLIFWALGQSAAETNWPWGVLSVYGDDIICDQTLVPTISRLLSFCGFDLNKEKSFAEGLFFESCGKHFFNHRDVTPVYQKEILDNDREIIRFHNRLVRWTERTSLELLAKYPLYRAASPESSLCLIPEGVEGDDGFLVPIETLIASRAPLDANRGVRSRVITGKTRRLPGVELALLALELRRTSMRSLPPSGVGDFLVDRLPTYGDVSLNAEQTAANSVQYGQRWIVPPGYCPLPRR
jgi:hypothetical protein